MKRTNYCSVAWCERLAKYRAGRDLFACCKRHGEIVAAQSKLGRRPDAPRKRNPVERLTHSGRPGTYLCSFVSDRGDCTRNATVSFFAYRGARHSGQSAIKFACAKHATLMRSSAVLASHGIRRNPSRSYAEMQAQYAEAYHAGHRAFGAGVPSSHGPRLSRGAMPPWAARSRRFADDFRGWWGVGWWDAYNEANYPHVKSTRRPQ